MSKRKKAEKLNARAFALQQQGYLKEAIASYLEASEVDPKWSTPHFNLGLLFKRERKWKESLTYNQVATAIDPTNQEGWWNLGIAATALRRWDVARTAWRGYGIDVPDGDGPVDLSCGFGPIRINAEADAEVVWAHRLDPARAEIASIPFPESKLRWCDVVLNDGAPVGYRQYQGQEVPVLDAIELFEASPFGTFVAKVAMPNNQHYVEKLGAAAMDLKGSAEDWSTSVRLLCKACSEGRPHKKHDTEAAPPDGIHLIGIAARSLEHASKILDAWQASKPDVKTESLDVALEPGPGQ